MKQESPHMLQRAILAPKFLTSANIVQLQRTIGNKALREFLADGVQSDAESNHSNGVAQMVRKDFSSTGAPAS
jgi:hypothetical protein